MKPENLNTNILYLIGEVAHLFHKRITEAFRSNGIEETVEQFSILALLFYSEGINQQEIALQLCRDKTTITRVVGNMISKGLIKKVSDSEDLRSKKIYLTDLGKERQSQLIGVVGKEYMHALKQIDEPELTVALRVLQKIKSQVQL